MLFDHRAIGASDLKARGIPILNILDQPDSGTLTLSIYRTLKGECGGWLPRFLNSLWIVKERDANLAL
jgi:hypothetical protein